MQIDTRIPSATLRWISIGRVVVVYENDKWWLRLHIGFFHKEWDFEKLVGGRRKKAKHAKSIVKTKRKKKGRLKKIWNVIRSFRVTAWELAIDTDDVVRNAWLFPLNFFPPTRRHVNINFADENYLIMIIRNAPWKLAYSFLK